jgi:putative membrane protein
MHHGRTLLTLLAVTTAMTSCRLLRPMPDAPAADTTQPTEMVQTAVPRITGPMRDANVAAMLLAWNNTDISYARLVPSRAQRDDVKRFAERMLTDHTGINSLVTALLEKMDIGAEDNIASLNMRDESATKRDLMRDLQGFVFDSAYATNELSYHRRFLSSLDNEMIPAAKNDDLRTLLNTIRPAVAAHMAHAEQLWADVLAKR